MNSFQNNFVKVINYSKNIESYNQKELYDSIVDLRGMHGDMLGGFYKNMGNDLNNQDNKVELSFLDSMIDTTRKVLQLAESKFNYNSGNPTMKGGSNKEEEEDEVEEEKPKKTSKYEAYRTTPILFAFTAKWCGHCHHFLPTFEKLRREYVNDNKLKCINVDEENNKELVESYGVEGFPTIQLYDGKKFHEYTGGRDINNIRDFVNKILKTDAIKG